MGNFTFSEIFTIIVVILIVFGPNRLPEIARNAGRLAARARAAMDSLRNELDAEYGDVIKPLREARDELRATGSDIKGQVAKLGEEVSAAGRDLKGATERLVDSGATGSAKKDVPTSEPEVKGDEDVTEPPAPGETEADDG